MPPKPPDAFPPGAVLGRTVGIDDGVLKFEREPTDVPDGIGIKLGE